MVHIFEGNTADEVWISSATKLLAQEPEVTQASRGGATQELLHAMYCINNPHQRWVVSRRPGLNPAFAIAEVIWILSGRDDSAFLNFWNRDLQRYSGNDERYHGAYGYRLRKLYGIDQLELAYFSLLSNPDGRQVVLQIWHPMLDFPAKDGTPINTDIPCNIVALLKIRKNKLEWTQILRSNDLIRGVPYNFVQFTSLQEILAGWLGIEVGSYHHFSDSLHVYQSDIKQFYISETVNLVNNDLLYLSKTEFDTALANINHRVELLIEPNLAEKKLQALIYDDNLHPSYYNLFLIVAAEAARRYGWVKLIEDSVVRCSNPMLSLIWNQWYSRFKATAQKTGRI